MEHEQEQEQDGRPQCCGQPMHRDGHHWSGRHQVQRWKCQRCGRTTIKAPEGRKP